MTWNRVQYKEAARAQADAENSARWSDTQMSHWLAYCYDEGWRRILNGNPTYRYTELNLAANSSGHVLISAVNTALTPSRMYRVLDPRVVRDYRLAGPTNVVLMPHVSGDVINFGAAGAGTTVKFWVNTLPRNPEAAITTALWGDVNDDGVINSADVTQIQRYAVSLSVDCITALLQRGDLTGDGAINNSDAQQLSQWIATGTASNATAQARIGNPVGSSAAVDPCGDARAVTWPDGHELVLANYLAAFMLTKGAVQSRYAADLFAVCDSMFTSMIQALMDRSTAHQQIVPTDTADQWSGGMNW